MRGRSQQLSSSHPHTTLSSSSMDAASAYHTNYPSSLPLHSRRQHTSVEKFSHHLDNDIRDLGLDLLRSYSLQPPSEVYHTAAIHNSAHGRHHDLPRWSSEGFINSNSNNSTRRLFPGTVLQPHSLPLPLPVTFGSKRKPVFPAGVNGESGGDAYPLPSPDEGVNRGQNDKGRGWEREKGKTIEKERLKENRNRDGAFSPKVDFFSGRISTLQEPQSPGPRRSVDRTETRSSVNRSHGLNLTDRTEPNFGIQVPFSSAPPSSYSSPVLSPRRMSTGDIFSSFPHQTQQLRSAPEMPPIDVHSSFPFTSLQDKALFGLDYSPIQSPQAPTPKRVRNSVTRPASPGCPGSLSSTLMVHHENNGNAIDVHIWPRSKSRPTSPVQPRLFIDTSMVHQEYKYNVNVPSLPQSQSRSHPASPVRPRFPADTLMAHQENNYPLLQSQSKSHPVSPVRPRFPADTPMVHHENKTVVHGHPLPIPPSPKTPAHSSVSQITPWPELHNQWSKAKFIGRGTSGSVFEATNKETGAMCAMKEVELCPDDPMAVRCMKQLEQEIEVLSHLKHPNIVQYYGSEIVDDKFYIYLELVYPGSINKYIRETALTESVVRNFTRHILSGLAYLHSTKTIHRDIKAANLLVDASGVVKLADFGMAKHLTEHAAELSLKGSPYWMAPELMQAVLQKDTSPDLAFAVDIWSLGCTVIEMFTGRPPWHEYEGAAAMFKVQKESPPLPENLSEEGKNFLRCCFRRDPAERPSASKLLEHQFVTNSGYPVDVLGNTQSPKGLSTAENGCIRRDLTAHLLDRSVTTSPKSRELWERKCFILKSRASRLLQLVSSLPSPLDKYHSVSCGTSA